MAPKKGSNGMVKSARKLRYEKRIRRQEKNIAKEKASKAANEKAARRKVLRASDEKYPKIVTLRASDEKSAKEKATELKIAELEAANLKEFHLFPKLPAELRIKVWKAAITPRFLFVVGPDIIPGFLFHQSVKVPAVLHVCKDARFEALKAYTKVATINPFYDFYNQMYNDHNEDPPLLARPSYSKVPEVTFYLNKNDTLYVPNVKYRFIGACEDMCLPGSKNYNYVTEKIQRIALALPDPDDFLDIFWEREHQGIFDQLCNFRSLEEISILVGKDTRSLFLPSETRGFKLTDASSFMEENETTEGIKEAYTALLKKQQERNGVTWKAPKVIVQGVICEKGDDVWADYFQRQRRRWQRYKRENLLAVDRSELVGSLNKLTGSE